MKLTFLGSGTSQGIPVIGCKCTVCASDNSKDKRLRSSVLVENDEDIFTIDAGPDFRQQLLRENVNKLSAILITHGHKDHIGGLDDVRAFNYLQKKPMDIWADKSAIESIKKEFHYAFKKNKYPGLPSFNIHTINTKYIEIGSTKVTPIPLLHHKLEVKAFRIKDLSYITDANYIPEESYRLLEGSNVLIINALRKEKHVSHFNLKEALMVIERIKPQKAYITHISHLMGLHNEVIKELPKNVFFAYDGLTIDF
ncbi:MAG: MBL fold metallo-hydrolase [Bacteroidales bacterium]|nr:MBL fold metallo-hydrolase [Bacteroidales bacterium]